MWSADQGTQRLWTTDASGGRLGQSSDLTFIGAPYWSDKAKQGYGAAVVASPDAYYVSASYAVKAPRQTRKQLFTSVPAPY